MPRLLKTVYEIVYTKWLKDSGTSCSGLVNPAKCLAHFNNFILVINASSGFFVYCFIGAFGQKFLEVLTSRCRSSRASNRGNEMQMDQIGLGGKSKASKEGEKLILLSLLCLLSSVMPFQLNFICYREQGQEKGSRN